MPLSTSNYLNLLIEAQSAISLLGLFSPIDQSLVEVQVKKYGFWLSGISLPALPVILVIGEEYPDSVTPWSSENEVLVKYMIFVLSIAAGNKDNTANLDVWLNWREQQRQLFQWGLQPKIASALFSEYVGNPPLLKEAFLKNYDVSGFGMRIWNIEPRIAHS